MKQYETQRLFLREFNPAVRRQLEKSSDKEKAHYLGSSNYLELLSLENQFLDAFIDTPRQSFRHWLLVCKDGGRVIGDCGFHRWAKIHKWAEVGYGLRSAMDRNKGLMSEALEKVIAIGFEEMDLRRIEAFVETDNLASLRLMHKMGFQAEGRLSARHEQGKKDLILFGLTPGEPLVHQPALPYLVDAFERRTLPARLWTHRAHLEVGLWYLLQHNWSLALLKMRNGILGYNNITGTPNTSNSGYHETLTQFWLRILARYLTEHRTDLPYYQHCDAFWMSPESSNELPLEYYSGNRLFSIQARAEWVAPDLKKLQ